MEPLKEFAGDITVYCLGVFSAVVLVRLLWTFTREDETETASDFNLFLQTGPPPTVNVPVPLLQTERENDMIEINLRNEAVQTMLSNDNFENEYSELTENDEIESESIVHSNEPVEIFFTDSVTNESQTSENFINIKLQYLDNRIRFVQSLPQENFGDFKRKHFSRELSSNKPIHLIFMEKLLIDNEASLSSLGFCDNCVVHCLMNYQDIEGHPLLNIWIPRIKYFFRIMWNIFLFLNCLVLSIIFVLCFILANIYKRIGKYFKHNIFIVLIYFGLYNAEQEHLM